MSSSSQLPPGKAPFSGSPAGLESLALLDAVQALVVLLDAQGRILHLNRCGARVLGYTTEEARGRKLEELAPPGQTEARAALARLVAGPHPACEESPWCTPDGQRRLIEWSTTPPAPEADGEAPPLVLTGVEVTERAQARLALQEQVHFLQTLIDSIPNPLFYKSLDGRYRGCNRAFTEMLGVTREQLLGRSVWDMSPPELAARYAAKDQELFDHPGLQQYESAVRFASGEVRDVIFYKATYTDTSGQLAGLVGVVLDITERKRAEVALQQARDELEERVRQRTAELERLKDAAEAADRTKSEFLNLAAHELRTPLTALSLVLQQARRQLHPEASQEARLISRMERYTGRLTRLAGDLLDASHLERGQLRLRPRPFDLGELVADVTEDFRHQHPRRQLEVVLSGEPSPVEADRERLEQVLANLLDNAVKYTPPEVRLEVRLEALPSSFRVSVSDEGPGIPSEEHARLFERFHRLSSSVHQPGLGLGLYISRQIVENHGGSIGLHCVPGHPGCTFFFEMPRRP